MINVFRILCCTDETQVDPASDGITNKKQHVINLVK